MRKIATSRQKSSFKTLQFETFSVTVWENKSQKGVSK